MSVLDFLGESKSTSNPDEIRFCCPFTEKHGGIPDSKFHLYYNPRKGKWYCFKCGSKGTSSHLANIFGLEDTGVAPTHLQFQNTMNELFSIDEDLEMPEIDFPCETRPILSKTPPMEYLMGRGVGIQTVRSYRLVWGYYGGCQRIFVPVFRSGKMVYWVARQFTEGPHPKYMSPTTTKKNLLFGIENANHDTLIITEGVFDAIAVGGVALFGKSCSDIQFSLLMRRNATEYVVALDGDAKIEAQSLASRILSHGRKVAVVYFYREEDPADAVQSGTWEKRYSDRREWDAGITRAIGLLSSGTQGEKRV